MMNMYNNEYCNKKEFLYFTLPDQYLGISIVDFDLRLYARFTFFTNI